MKKEYITLENKKMNIKREITDNKLEISSLEKKVRSLKSKNSKLETKIAEINGEQVKLISRGRTPKIYLNKIKGMI